MQIPPNSTKHLQPMAHWGRRGGEHEASIESDEGTHKGATAARPPQHLSQQGALYPLLSAPEDFEAALEVPLEEHPVEPGPGGLMRVQGKPIQNQSGEMSRPLYLWSFVDALYPVEHPRGSTAAPLLMEQPDTYQVDLKAPPRWLGPYGHREPSADRPGVRVSVDIPDSFSVSPVHTPLAPLWETSPADPEDCKVELGVSPRAPGEREARRVSQGLEAFKNEAFVLGSAVRRKAQRRGSLVA